MPTAEHRARRRRLRIYLATIATIAAAGTTLSVVVPHLA